MNKPSANSTHSMDQKNSAINTEKRLLSREEYDREMQQRVQELKAQGKMPSLAEVLDAFREALKKNQSQPERGAGTIGKRNPMAKVINHGLLKPGHPMYDQEMSINLLPQPKKPSEKHTKNTPQKPSLKKRSPAKKKRSEK